MNTTAEVYLWNTRIGIIHQEPDAKFALFEYDKKFLESGIQLSPIMMPLSEKVYGFANLADTSYYGLPGLVADSLPDSFGNKIIEKWLLDQGKSINDFTAIDRLCYTGTRGMGALEYVPASFDIEVSDKNIDVNNMVEFTSLILNDRTKIRYSDIEKLTYSQLIQVGTSAGGARAKALIAYNKKTNEVRSGQINLPKNFDYWLIKFGNVKENGDHGLVDASDYVLVEYTYYKMALDAGIIMNECKILKCDNVNHFMTKRFDRVDGKKIHMQTLGALTHSDYRVPCEMSYELAVQYMRQIGIGSSDIEQFYLRMVFNVIAKNNDDHVKNFSFLMDREGKWILAPAYDLTYSYVPNHKWVGAHQMTINKKSSDILISDLLEAGKKMGISKIKCDRMIEKVMKVVNNFAIYANECGLYEIDKYKFDLLNS